jgi:hypothetical protein
MKKLPKITLIVLVVLVVAYFGVTFLLGSAITAGVNRFGPMIAHTKVHLDSASLSPLSGGGTLKGLVVGNPQGWGDDDAFAMSSIHVSVAPFSVLGDHIVVKEVLIDGPEFTYETKVLSSNIGDLLKGMDSAKPEDASAPQAQPETKSGKPLKFEVRHFRLENGKIRLGVGSSAVTLPMPTIDLTDLGTKEGGVTPNQLAVAVMRSVSSSIVTATTQAAGKIGSTMGAAVSSGIKGLFGRH